MNDRIPPEVTGYPGVQPLPFECLGSDDEFKFMWFAGAVYDDRDKLLALGRRFGLTAADVDRLTNAPLHPHDDF